MRSLIKFILRYSNFLVLIILEIAAFMLIVKNNDYPHSSYLSTSNKIVAWNYQVMDDIHSYFGLRTVNVQLEKENAELRNKITQLSHFQEDSVQLSGSQWFKIGGG